MSIAPDDLIAGVHQADVLAEAVEEHLDAHPLPVDEEEAARATDRLRRRIAAEAPQASPWRWRVAGLAVAAAVVILGLWAGVERSGGVMRSDDASPSTLLEAAPDPSVRVVTVPYTQRVAGRSLAVDTGSTVLTSEQGSGGVVLVQAGAASLDDVAIPAAHWAVVVSSDAEVVVFPDGEAPPVEVPADVEAQLDDLRWRALPPRTLEALDALLAEP